MVQVNNVFLTSHSLFGGLTSEQVQCLRPYLEEEVFSPGSYIVREGELGTRLFFILSGQVEVLKSLEPDKAMGGSEVENVQLTILGPGDAFGEMAIIDVQPRSASVRVLETRVRTFSLSCASLHKIHRKYPEIFVLLVLNMAREISRRLRAADDKACSALFATRSD